MSPVLYSREGTIDRVVQKIDELGQEGVQFATFPETVVPYYPYFSFVLAAYQIIAGREHLKLLEQAVTVPSPATNAISDACKEARVVVSIGVNERDGGTLYDTQHTTPSKSRGHDVRGREVYQGAAARAAL
jgi:aliphatic nitrilase